TLASTPGEGTTASFEVELKPLDAVVPDASAKTRRIVGFVRGSKRVRILVADDQPEGRQLLVRLLEPLGFELREAANGQEAVEVWREWRPQLICMDMRMPVMDGRQATRLIKATQQGRETIVIAVTASS